MKTKKRNQSQPSVIQIKDVPLFKGLSSESIEFISRHVQIKRFTKGEMIALEGEPCRSIIIIRKGRVKVFRVAATGREQILQVLESGDTCACNPGAEQWSCTTSSQALTDGESWILPREYYAHLLINDSSVSQSLNRLFAERLCRFCHLIEEISLDSTRDRLVKFLLDMQSNGVARSLQGNIIALSFTREEIAQRLGTTRETVTRYLYQLKRKRLIDIHPKEITIRDPVALKKLLNKV